MLTVRQTCHLPSLALPEPTLLSFGTASGGKAIPGSKYGLKNGVDFTLFLWWQMFYPLRRCCQKCTVLRVGIFFVGWNGISKAVVRQRWGVMYFNGVTRVHAIFFAFLPIPMDLSNFAFESWQTDTCYNSAGDFKFEQWHLVWGSRIICAELSKQSKDGWILLRKFIM